MRWTSAGARRDAPAATRPGSGASPRTAATSASRIGPACSSSRTPAAVGETGRRCSRDDLVLDPYWIPSEHDTELEEFDAICVVPGSEAAVTAKV